MTTDSKVADTQTMPGLDDHETQRLSNLTERDVGIAHALEKIATSLDSVRLEMQGIRSVLEALVAKA
jgi:hypothetical protein